MIKILNIADKYKISFSIISFIIALFFSIASGDGGIFSFCLILISAPILAIGFAFWSIKEFKSLFLESLKITFGITSTVYIIGYIFYALEPIVL